MQEKNNYLVERYFIASLFVVAVKAVPNDHHPLHLLHTPIAPEEVVVHCLAAMGHEEQCLLFHFEFTMLILCN